MYVSAASMSDSEFEDDEDFRFTKKNRKSCSYKSQENSLNKKINHSDWYKDEYDNKEMEERNMINACRTGRLDIIEEYLQTHHVNTRFTTRWTALLYASLSAQPEVIQYLLTNGADPNKHKDGYTPLMALCSSTNNSAETRLKCLKLLLQANANVNATDKQRESCLMYACATQMPDFVAELLKNVKNINARDGKDKTALMYAVTANKADVVALLLERSADATLTDYNNMTAKDIAFTKKHSEILALLDPEEPELPSICEISEVCDWKDMFPSLTEKKNNEVVDCDVSEILYGMRLEHYTNLFRGIDLKTFLALTEEDLDRIGVDISVQKGQFMQYLHQFHMKKWNAQSIGAIKKSSSFTIYDGVVSLGTVGKHIRVIGSSFQYIKNNLMKAAENNEHLNDEQKSTYKQELEKTRKTVGILKKELEQLKTLTQKISKEKNIGVPTTYIAPKKNRRNWPIVLSVTMIIGIYLFRAGHIHRLWNN